MTLAREGRRLAAVMFVDMVGYSARMQDSESRAIEAVRWLWQQVRPILSAHGGREVDLAGDGMLMEFPGVLPALHCALRIHSMLRDENATCAGADRIRVRAGVHFGDIEQLDGRIYGDAINIAARVVALSPPGAVAMTAQVRDSLVNVLELPVHSLGLRTLKNIRQPMEVCCVCGPDCSPAELRAAQREGEAATRTSQPHNLPAPVTTLIGREQSLRVAQSLLRRPDVRLLTLTGPGGMGKTRLSLQLATELLAEFEHGAFLVDLAPITDPALFFPAIAKVLDVRETSGRPLDDSLKDALRSRQMLLLLDNFEQIVAAAPRVAELLAACPALKVLATSREALRLRGEHEFEVPSLTLPDRKQSLDIDALAECSAVALFTQRSQMVQPDFSLTTANAADVAEICCRLDGLPLAIELAAARSKRFTPALMREHLDRCFELVKDGARDLPERHQTLWTTIDWSYQLLDAAERALFQRLSVFVGGLTLDAAKAVCAGPPVAPEDVVHLLSRLVEKSLVRYQDQGEPRRYRLLETIREYSRDRLTDAGGTGAARARHLEFFQGLAESSGAHLGFFLADAEMIFWLQCLNPEHDNLRAALEWSQIGEAGLELGLRLAGALHWFWFAHGDFTQARSLLDPLLRKAHEAPAMALAPALHVAGYLALWQGDFAAGRHSLTESLRLFEPLPQQGWTGFALSGLGFAALGTGDLALARSWFAQSLSLARALDDPWLIAFSLHFAGHVAAEHGDNSGARAAFEESNALCRHLGGNTPGVAHSFFALGRIATAESDYEQAQAHHREALRLFQTVGDPRGVAYVLLGFARLAAAQHRPRRAARLLGALAALRAAMGFVLETRHQLEHDQSLAEVRAAVDETSFAAEFAQGQVLNLEQTVAYALEGHT